MARGVAETARESESGPLADVHPGIHSWLVGTGPRPAIGKRACNVEDREISKYRAVRKELLLEDLQEDPIQDKREDEGTVAGRSECANVYRFDQVASREQRDGISGSEVLPVGPEKREDVRRHRDKHEIKLL